MAHCQCARLIRKTLQLTDGTTKRAMTVMTATLTRCRHLTVALREGWLSLWWWLCMLRIVKVYLQDILHRPHLSSCSSSSSCQSSFLLKNLVNELISRTAPLSLASLVTNRQISLTSGSILSEYAALARSNRWSPFWVRKV